MRNYELVWILGSDATEEEGAESVDRVKALVTQRGGEVAQAELWARRTFSYPIHGSTEGAYYIARFSLDSLAAPEVERSIEADQMVIRHLLVRQDKISGAGPISSAETEEDSGGGRDRDSDGDDEDSED